mmetsp:Transcript_28004/g.42124  ORF Transcript_28004/g.42124 Transcript_28004/m.42124 type:complete len:431 (-) Transcript_28004:1341-2633(-)
MSAQQHVHNIFAETHDEQQHDEADANNDVAYRSYENRPVAEAAAAGTTNNTGTAAEEGIPPPAIPPVTNLYNAAQSVGGSVMPHAQMLLQAAAGGGRQLLTTTTTTTAGTMPYSVVAQPPNNHQLPRPPMNIFDAAEDAYAQHIADLHAASQYATVDATAPAAAANNENSNDVTTDDVGGPIAAPTLPPIYPKNIGMPETIIPTKWLTRYNELKRYKQVHGDCCVPQDAPQHKQLSAWVRTQKQQYKLMKEGKHCHMSQPRVELLNEIDFEWSGVKRDQFWKDRYNELVQFHSKHEHTRVPEKYSAAPQLHSWVSLQRRQLKLRKEGKKNKLSDERLKLLEVLGMEHQIRNTATWMDRFKELKEYKEKHGDCNVPQKYGDNPSLGRWVDNQKTQHKKLYDGKTTHLTIERIQLLAGIGFDFRPVKKDKEK